MVITPKSGRPVFGQTEVNSGSSITISYPGNWFGQVSISGDFASSPALACSAYSEAAWAKEHCKLKEIPASRKPRDVGHPADNKLRIESRQPEQGISLSVFHHQSCDHLAQRRTVLEPMS